jgi:hypothetical protein
MCLGSFFGRNRARAAERVPAVDPAGREPMEASSQERPAELQEAWAELAQAAEEAGVNSFHACARAGESWEDNPVAVRAVAATLRDFRADGTSEDAARRRPSGCIALRRGSRAK